MRRLVSTTLAFAVVQLWIGDVAQAQGPRFGDGIRGSRLPVVGFVGCDMHADGGPVVVLFQLATTNSTDGTATAQVDDPSGEPCAAGLLDLQHHGYGLLRPTAVQGMDPAALVADECLIWEIIGSEVGSPAN